MTKNLQFWGISSHRSSVGYLVQVWFLNPPSMQRGGALPLCWYSVEPSKRATTQCQGQNSAGWGRSQAVSCLTTPIDWIWLRFWSWTHVTCPVPVLLLVDFWRYFSHVFMQIFVFFGSDVVRSVFARLMENEAGAEVQEAGPSMACQVTGFQDSPQAPLGPAETSQPEWRNIFNSYIISLYYGGKRSDLVYQQVDLDLEIKSGSLIY